VTTMTSANTETTANVTHTGDTATAVTALDQVLATGRALRRHIVTAMGISARMGAEQ